MIERHNGALGPGLVERLQGLEDLTERARSQVEPGSDLWEHVAVLSRDFESRSEPYKISVPYRNPPRPCSICGELIPMVDLEIHDPRRRKRSERKVILSAREIHDIKVHGVCLSARQEALLRWIGRKG